MGGLIGGGKSRSRGRSGALVPGYLGQYPPQGDVLAQFNPIQEEVFAQLSEALRTGGVGAQIPIVQQSVAQSQSALSQGLRDIESQQARTGLAGTPFGERTLQGARLQGLQDVARIPTDYAQQQIAQAPQLVQGILSAILGSLSSISTSSSRAGPFST